MATPLSPICQKIQNQIDSLKQEKKSLQAELQDASPGQKSALAKKIKALDPQITAKNTALQACIKKNPYVPPPPPKGTKPCASLKKEVATLKAALRKQIHDAVADLQEDLKHASPGQKPAIAKEIKQITADITKNSPTGKKLAAKQKEYDKCVIDSGGALAVNATFTGTATMKTSNSKASGPFNQKISIGLYFSEADTKTEPRDVEITSFPSIPVTYDTPIGEVTTTVSKQSGSGSFNPKTNKITLDLGLLFKHSTILAGESTLAITLKTESPLTAKGNITVSGSSKFQGGYLGGDTCWLTVKGTISPHP